MNDSDIERRLTLAREIAEAAGQLTLNYFQTDDIGMQRKADDSPVTIADREAEQLMRKRIESAFPDDGIVGEEWGEKEGTNSYQWVLDPIDGTKSFICGVPLYSVLVGVLREDNSLIGVIAIPGMNESVYAARGGGAWYCQGQEPPRRTKVSERASLGEGTFVTSQVDTFAKRGAAEAYLELEKHAYITRTWGDGYGYLLVATGRAEVIVDPLMNLWDAAALLPVMEEAGGHFLDWQGNASIHHGEGVGCTARVRDEVLAITRRFPMPDDLK